MKKDDLLKENGALIDTVEKLSTKLKEQDTTQRQDFARVFNWYSRRGRYDSEIELRTPTWAEIHAEIGRLQAARTFYDMDGNISELECAVADIKKRLDEQPPLHN